MFSEVPQTPASMQTPSNAQQPNLDDIKKKVSAHLSRMLRFRRPYDPVRFQWFKQYVSKRDQKLFPDGITPRANTFVPYAYSNVETVVSRAMDAFFSVKPFFEASGRTEQDGPAADKMQLVLESKLQHANLPQSIEALIRNIAIYGHAAIKVDWDWGYDIVTGPEPVYAMIPLTDEQGQPVLDANGQLQPVPAKNPVTGEPIVQGVHLMTRKVPRKRPRFTVIDIYDLLVDPDGGMTALLVEKTFGEMQRENETYTQQYGTPLYDPEAMQSLAGKLSSEEDADTIIIRMAEFWNDFDGTYTLITFGEDRDALAWKDQRYGIRAGSAYSPYKRRMYTGDNLLLFHGENPFAHKRCPILHTSYVKLPNETYGIGVIESGSELNEALNQMVSMIRDNWNMGVNHRFLYDTGMDIDHEAMNNANVPGGKVGVNGDPAKAIFPLPQFTPNPGDYSLLDLYKGMIALTTGIDDFYSKGVGGGGPNNTATGIQSIIQESNYRFRMFIRNVELDVLQPLLEMCAAMVQQYMTDPEEVMITNAPPGIPKYMQVMPEQIMGSVQFQLVAANYATNEVVRQRNLMALAGMLGESPFIDQYQALKLLLKTFKIPEDTALLKSPEQVQQEQQQQQQDQIQMMLLEHNMALQKAVVGAQAKAEYAPNKDGKNGKTGNKPGRPRSPMQPEGKTPGAGITSPIRELAQNTGMNALGLEGMGEAGM